MNIVLNLILATMDIIAKLQDKKQQQKLEHPGEFDLLDRITVREYLQSLFQKTIDLISTNNIHPYIKKRLLSD